MDKLPNRAFKMERELPILKTPEILTISRNSFTIRKKLTTSEINC